MDPHWFNYLLAIWPNKPKANELPPYVLDNMRKELDLFVSGHNAQLRQQEDLPYPKGGY